MSSVESSGSFESTVSFLDYISVWYLICQARENRNQASIPVVSENGS
jgi:hypothetical protein